MNRILRFLIFLIAKILAWFFILLVRFLLLPLFVWVLRLLRDLVSLSFTATVNGPAKFIDRLAGEWTESIYKRVDDRSRIPEVNQLCRFLAGALFVLGWVVSIFFTATILRVVFGFFI